MEERVEQHRAVTGRQHETVAVRPRRIGGIEFQKTREQHRGHVGRAHRQAGVAGLGLFDGVHSQRANRIGEAAMSNARGRRRARSHQERAPLAET